MKNYFFPMFLQLNICLAQPPELNNVRALFEKASVEEKACKKILSLLQPYDENANPVLAGYKASATMIMAKHVVNPFSKLSYFRKGKTILEKSIQANKTNVELRFLRLAIQSNIPAFLGYKNNMSSDKSFLMQSFDRLKDQQLKQLIAGLLKTNY